MIRKFVVSAALVAAATAGLAACSDTQGDSMDDHKMSSNSQMSGDKMTDEDKMDDGHDKMTDKDKKN